MNLKHRRLAGGSVVALFLLLLAPVARASDGRSLVIFPVASPSGDEIREAAQKPIVAPLRRGFVGVDLPALRALSTANKEGSPALAITIAIFDDVVFNVEFDQIERNPIGAEIWTGRIAGMNPSSAIIAVDGSSISATFRTAEGVYTVRSSPRGVEASELGFSYPEDEVRIPSVELQSSKDQIAGDTDGVADILGLYTTRTRMYLGGVSAARARLSESIAATNQAFQNSGVVLRVRLVGAQEVAYADDQFTQSEALTHLTTPNDGFIDHVHPQRDLVGADAIALLVRGGSGCGVAWIMGSNPEGHERRAMSITEVDCAVDNLSFPHELGHNFGLHHDRKNATSQGSFPYAYGYQDPEGQFRDVMAYATQCSGTGRPCTRMSFFSNPDLMVMGRPGGVNHLLSDSADNRLALNNHTQTVSNFRQAVAAMTFTDDPIMAGVTIVKALHVAELRSAIDGARTRLGLGAYSWSTPPAVGAFVTAAQVVDLRTAVLPILQRIGAVTAFTDEPLVAGSPIRAIHLQEIRDRLRL